MAAVYVTLQVAAASVALWLSKHFEVARLAATAVALAPTLPSAYLAWIAYRDDRTESAADTDPWVKALAASVTAAETRQRAQLIGPGAHRIDLAFRCRQELANNAVGAAPQGHLNSIVDYYQRLRPARLVITGDPGAGKTLLALDLLLGLLSCRADTAPVPFRASLASWDTTRPLEEWLAEEIHNQLRGHGISATAARALVDQHRVLPILDGLDEMDSATTPAARRRATRALEELNVYQDPAGSAPVILTCRTAQYAELAALDVRMREAARIEIASVNTDQAAEYLMARSANPARWAPAVEALAAAPGGTLARALSTPWQLNLAVTAYEERHPDTLAYLREPADLLTLSSPSAVRQHLLALYLPAAVSQHPTRPDRYRPDQVHRWLAALAAHLTTAAPSAAGGTGSDLVLHQLWPLTSPRRTRATDALVATLLFLPLLTLDLFTDPWHEAAAIIGGLGWFAVQNALRASVPIPRSLQLPRLQNPAHRRRAARSLSRGLQMGLVFGLLLGLVGLTVGLGIGLLFGSLPFVPTAVGNHMLGPMLGLGAFGVGLVMGLVAGLVDALMPHAEATHTSGLELTTDPRSLVWNDLMLGVGLVLVLGGLGLMIGVGFMAGLLGLTVGLGTGLAFGMYELTGAGRRYVVFLCCSRGRLPWRLGTFLHWSYGAGLLRVSGIAYQFRHRELQDWLVSHSLPQLPASE